MSGSSERNSGGSFEPILRCETINFTTDVNSPQPDALIGLKIDEILDIQLHNHVVVVVRRDNKTVLGSINWTNVLKLIECLEQGYKYVAVVRYVQDGLVKVAISAARGN